MRIGIIGAGAAGLTTAWLLDPDHDVTLFEKRPRLGGHVDTVEVERDGERIHIDAGFEFFDGTMFPTFTRLLGILGVPVRSYPITVTLHHADHGRVTLLPPVRGRRVPWSALGPRQLLDLLQFQRVYGKAARLVGTKDPSLTLDDFLKSVALTTRFREGVIYPCLLGGWDVDLDEFKRFSAYNVLKYFVLTRSSAQWTEVAGGARVYVDALARALTRTDIRRSANIEQISRAGDRWVVRDTNGRVGAFDHLVVATNAYEARQLLAGIHETERLCRDLSAIEYFKTTIAVHGDRRLMPARETHWSVANIRYDGVHSASTIWKGWKSSAPVFRSWITHDTRSIDPLYAVATYYHPKPTPDYFRMQPKLAARQGQDRLWLAGLYTHDIDCHESAILSAVKVAEGLAPRSANLTRLLGSARASSES